MTMYEDDPDVVRWGLHLLDGCSLSYRSSAGPVAHYNWDLSQLSYVKEGYCQPASLTVENDEMIAQAFQEELSRVAEAEAAGTSHAREQNQQVSILSQDWGDHSRRHYNSASQSNQEDADEAGSFRLCPDPGEIAFNSVSQSNQEDADEAGSIRVCPDPVVISFITMPEQCSPVIEDESVLDGEVGKRLNQMVPVRHVPRTNREIPSVDEATSDHQRLLERLELYDLVELKVSGDGNCQFRSLSDQIYRTFEHHKFVRRQIVDQLKSYPELYEAYVPMGYDEYIRRMSKNGEWGDHVTLQAAADSYGLQIFVITSFKDTCYIEILPREQKSKRMIALSFWAEVHYNSIYPKGELPAPETKKKKRWWWPIV